MQQPGATDDSAPPCQTSTVGSAPDAPACVWHEVSGSTLSCTSGRITHARTDPGPSGASTRTATKAGTAPCRAEALLLAITGLPWAPSRRSAASALTGASGHQGGSGPGTIARVAERSPGAGDRRDRGVARLSHKAVAPESVCAAVQPGATPSRQTRRAKSPTPLSGPPGVSVLGVLGRCLETLPTALVCATASRQLDRARRDGAPAKAIAGTAGRSRVDVETNPGAGRAGRCLHARSNEHAISGWRCSFPGKLRPPWDAVASESLCVRLRRCTPRAQRQTGGGPMRRSLAIRRQKTGATITGASITGASVVGPRLLGPSAMAPLAIAASPVGALAIGRLAIADAVIRKLRAEEIEIGSLKVRELEVAGQRWPGSLPPSTA
jgi:hypothetical protein